MERFLRYEIREKGKKLIFDKTSKGVIINAFANK